MVGSYSISKSDLILNGITLSGASFGLQHLELAKSEPNNYIYWGHIALLVSECIPVIGILVAAVEYAVTRYFPNCSLALDRQENPLLKKQEPNVSMRYTSASNETLNDLNEKAKNFQGQIKALQEKIDDTELRLSTARQRVKSCTNNHESNCRAGEEVSVNITQVEEQVKTTSEQLQYILAMKDPAERLLLEAAQQLLEAYNAYKKAEGQYHEGRRWLTATEASLKSHELSVTKKIVSERTNSNNSNMRAFVIARRVLALANKQAITVSEQLRSIYAMRDQAEEAHRQAKETLAAVKKIPT